MENHLRLDLLDRSLARIVGERHKYLTIHGESGVVCGSMMATLPIDGSTVMNGRQLEMLRREYDALESDVGRDGSEVLVQLIEAINRGPAGYVLVSGR